MRPFSLIGLVNHLYLFVCGLSCDGLPMFITAETLSRTPKIFLKSAAHSNKTTRNLYVDKIKRIIVVGHIKRGYVH